MANTLSGKVVHTSCCIANGMVSAQVFYTLEDGSVWSSYPDDPSPVGRGFREVVPAYKPVETRAFIGQEKFSFGKVNTRIVPQDDYDPHN